MEFFKNSMFFNLTKPPSLFPEDSNSIINKMEEKKQKMKVLIKMELISIK